MTLKPRKQPILMFGLGQRCCDWRRVAGPFYCGEFGVGDDALLDAIDMAGNQSLKFQSRDRDPNWVPNPEAIVPLDRSTDVWSDREFQGVPTCGKYVHRKTPPSTLVSSRSVFRGTVVPPKRDLKALTATLAYPLETSETSSITSQRNWSPPSTSGTAVGGPYYFVFDDARVVSFSGPTAVAVSGLNFTTALDFKNASIKIVTPANKNISGVGLAQVSLAQIVFSLPPVAQITSYRLTVGGTIFTIPIGSPLYVTQTYQDATIGVGIKRITIATYYDDGFITTGIPFELTASYSCSFKPCWTATERLAFVNALKSVAPSGSNGESSAVCPDGSLDEAQADCQSWYETNVASQIASASPRYENDVTFQIQSGATYCGQFVDGVLTQYPDDEIAAEVRAR